VEGEEGFAGAGVAEEECEGAFGEEIIEGVVSWWLLVGGWGGIVGGRVVGGAGGHGGSLLFMRDWNWGAVRGGSW